MACDGGASAVVAIDLQTGTRRFQIQLDAMPLAVTAARKAIVVAGEALGGAQQAGQARDAPVVYAFDALTGSLDWSAPLPIQADAPVAVAIAADGVSVYAVGPAPASSGLGSGESAPQGINLIAFDGGGRVVAPTPLRFTAPADRTANLTLAVKPQGDRAFFAGAALAINPRGDRLVSTSRPTAVIAVGHREPSAWTLTAGTVVPVPRPGEVPGIDAQLTGGALSQVVPVAPGCFHDLTVNVMVPESSAGADAATETFWLDATGALLRSDSLALPVSNLFVTRRTRAVPPAGSAQAEVRVSVTGDRCMLRAVSLKSTDELLQDDAWEPDPATPASIVVTGNVGGTAYRNVGTEDAALEQHLELDPSLTYALDFSGDATPGGQPRTRTSSYGTQMRAARRPEHRSRSRSPGSGSRAAPRGSPCRRPAPVPISALSCPRTQRSRWNGCKCFRSIWRQSRSPSSRSPLENFTSPARRSSTTCRPCPDRRRRAAASARPPHSARRPVINPVPIRRPRRRRRPGRPCG